MTEIPIHSKINPSMHPARIRGDSQGAKSARNALSALYWAEGTLRDLHDVVHQKALLQQKQFVAALPKPPDGKKKIGPALIYDQGAADHVIEVGTPIAKSALKISDTAITELGTQVGRLDATIDQKITAGRNSNRGAELRAWASRQDSPFLALGPLFQKANENQTLVAEVLLGESFLSGISADNKAALRAVAANVLAPDEVQDRKETSEALEHLTTSARKFTEIAAEIMNGLRSPDADAINSIVKQGDE